MIGTARPIRTTPALQRTTRGLDHLEVGLAVEDDEDCERDALHAASCAERSR
jgi:hypothetical protein